MGVGNAEKVASLPSGVSDKGKVTFFLVFGEGVLHSAAADLALVGDERFLNGAAAGRFIGSRDKATSSVLGARGGHQMAGSLLHLLYQNATKP